MQKNKILSKQDYVYYLECDRKALGKASSSPPLLFFKNPIWHFQRLLRKLEYFSNCYRSFPGEIYTQFLRYRFIKMQIQLGFHIPINTIGPGLYITHIGPIVIHDKVKIGANLRINIGVVIGQKGKATDVPTIGNNVVIEPGCKIFGKINIADGIHIGANAVVNKSFNEQNIVIAGVPAKKIGFNTRLVENFV